MITSILQQGNWTQKIERQLVPRSPLNRGFGDLFWERSLGASVVHTLNWELLYFRGTPPKTLSHHWPSCHLSAVEPQKGMWPRHWILDVHFFGEHIWGFCHSQKDLSHPQKFKNPLMTSMLKWRKTTKQPTFSRQGSISILLING